MDSEYFSSINDVSKRLDLPAHTLRYWEKQFPAAIKPTTGAGGRRYYRPETVQVLDTIKDLLYNHGMTIAGVKKLLKDGSFADKSDTASFGTQVPASAPKTVSAAPAIATADSGFFAPSVDLSQAIDLLERARTILS